MVEEPHIPAEVLHEAAISAGLAKGFIRSASEVAIERCRQTSISYVLVAPTGAVLGRILIQDVRSRAYSIIRRNKQRERNAPNTSEAMRQRQSLISQSEKLIQGETIANSARDTIAKSIHAGRSANKLRINGGVASECGRCGAGAVHDSTITQWTCKVCEGVTMYRQCPRCRKVLVIHPQLTNDTSKRWRCMDCSMEGLRNVFPTSSINDFADAPDPYYELYGDSVGSVISAPDRRRIDGTILSLEGISGIATGDCTIFFDPESILIFLGNQANLFRIEYSAVSSLQFAGRGAIETVTGGGWSGGGFGLEGVLKGVAMATILNALTTTKKQSIESIIYLSWAAGSLSLLNTLLLPVQWAEVLSPVIRRIDRERRITYDVPKDAMQSGVKTCPYCAETIKLAAVKCRYCGSGL